ncbi:hypothetical protein [Legionella tucsonensis]|uniref:Uncharacterized protein n=1 Tax=Legionella tucsonensis TaxID=40335 RepID=A0A0W0ZWE7_9GAMM|nr:hypothetical protein [Legionella tucsonensis]KTD73406.1 hypothetical protein Ltuc_1253 [Legionella tucsonensis]
MFDFIQKSMTLYQQIEDLNNDLEKQKKYKETLAELELMGAVWANRFLSSKMGGIYHVFLSAMGNNENYREWLNKWVQPLEREREFFTLNTEFVHSLDENYLKLVNTEIVRSPDGKHLAWTGVNISKIIEDGKIMIPTRGADIREFTCLFNLNDPEALAQNIYGICKEYLDRVHPEYEFVTFDVTSSLDDLLENPIDFITKDILDEFLLKKFHSSDTLVLNNTFQTLCSEVNFLRMLINLNKEKWPLSENNQQYLTYLQQLGALYMTGKSLLEDNNNNKLAFQSTRMVYEALKNAKENPENDEDPYEKVTEQFYLGYSKEEMIKLEAECNNRLAKISSLNNLEIILEQLNSSVLKSVLDLGKMMHQGLAPVLQLEDGWKIRELINDCDRQELIKSINIALGYDNEGQYLFRKILLDICNPENAECKLIEIIANTVQLEIKELTPSQENVESLRRC